MQKAFNKDRIEMFDDIHSLELSRKDLELIESALHTQQKILSMESSAGRAGAKARLIDLRHLLKRIGRQAPAKAAPAGQGWSRLAKSLFC